MKVLFKGPNTCSVICRLLAAALATLAASPAWAAGARTPADAEHNRHCLRDFCAPFNKTGAHGEFTCEAVRAWSKEEIASSSFGQRTGWSPGDIRCEITFRARREELAKAANETDYTLRLGKHPVICEVGEGEGKSTVKLTVDPEAAFKNGKAVKVALNVADIEASTGYKAALWSAAKLHNYFGVFGSELVERFNKFLQDDCGAPK